jgi:hypothetical protein
VDENKHTTYRMMKLRIAALLFQAHTTRAAGSLEMNSQPEPQVSEPRRLSIWAPEATRLTLAAVQAPQSPPLTRTQAGRLRSYRRAQVTGTMALAI